MLIISMGFSKKWHQSIAKNLLSEHENVKIHKIAISATLKEVVDAESSVASHTGKCQSDIDLMTCFSPGRV